MHRKLGFLTGNRIIILIVNVLLLCAFAICLSLSKSIKNTLRSQQAASAWAGQSGERFTQISAFLPNGAAFTENSIIGFHSAVDSALLEVSLEAKDGSPLYIDAWSALGEVSVVGERGSARVQVFGVGGDFFFFHPLYIRDGCYLSPDDLMKDRVVLDEELAWRLFGSVSLAGLTVTINNKPYFIAGVVSREDDFASTKAYASGAGMFMSYEALSEITGNNAEIICYEIVMPDPITGFAIGAFSDMFTYTEAIVENSVRYTFSNTLETIASYGKRSMRNEGIVFPYWENAARYSEDWIALLLVLSFLFAIYPAISGIIFFTKLTKFALRGGMRIVRKKIDQRDDRKAEQYRLAHIEETLIPSIEEIIREVQEEREKA